MDTLKMSMQLSKVMLRSGGSIPVVHPIGSDPLRYISSTWAGKVTKVIFLGPVDFDYHGY